jgi:hypothetical protein
VIVVVAFFAFGLLGAPLFAWEAPTAPGSPEEAVVRVVAPEGEPYSIDFGDGAVDYPEGVSADGSAYRDHPAPEGTDFSRIVFDKEGNEWGEPVWEGDAKVLLFKQGEYAGCNSSGNRSTSSGTVFVGDNSFPYVCKGYRFWSWFF